MHWEVCAAGGLACCALGTARGCRYNLLKTWGKATSQVKALDRDVKRHILTSRKLTGLLDCTLTKNRAETVEWRSQWRLQATWSKHRCTKNPQSTARAGPAKPLPKCYRLVVRHIKPGTNKPQVPQYPVTKSEKISLEISRRRFCHFAPLPILQSSSFASLFHFFPKVEMLISVFSLNCNTGVNPSQP